MPWYTTMHRRKFSYADRHSQNRPLQASVRALNRYRASQQALARKREECLNLEKKFSDLEHSVEHELETAKAIEMGLLEKLEEVESRCNSCVYSTSIF